MTWVSYANDTIVGPQIDIAEPEHVEVKIRQDGKVLWINVDGVCRLRICRITNLVLDNEQKIPEKI